MREDCNEGPGVGGVGGVLIHACAKIATVFSLSFLALHFCFDSCMLEDCNGRSSVDRVGTDQVLIHACAKIATYGFGY